MKGLSCTVKHALSCSTPRCLCITWRYVFFTFFLRFALFTCVQIWSGSYFQRISLRDLGHHVQLGHPPGVQCCNPALAFNDDFVVLEINGIHRLALNFCNCATAQTHDIQLLHARWYPSTTTNPRTAATFQLLDHFQMYTFESKGSAFKYYQSLVHLTDNTGTCQPKVSDSFVFVCITNACTGPL